MTDIAQSRALIEDVASELGVDVSNIINAAVVSQSKFEDAQGAARDKLKELRGSEPPVSEPIDIVAFGSMARGEMSEQVSDFDYVLLAYDKVTTPDGIQHVKEAAQHAKKSIELEPHGGFGGFGALSSFLDLVNLIGLETDTNANHTNRILLLEESMSILNPQGRKELIHAVIERYLYDYKPGSAREGGIKRGVPRHLLNDVARYWRTLAVDYQGKRWEEVRGEKWGIRYLKLRSVRKLTFAGTAASLFLPRITDQELSPELLAPQFELTPLARLAQLRDYLADAETKQVLAEVLVLADYFCERLGNREFREGAKAVAFPASSKVPEEFAEARAKSEELQDALERLFDSPSELKGSTSRAGGPLTLRYLKNRYLVF